MKSKLTSAPSHKTDVPYEGKDKTTVAAFWADATAHLGIEELRAKR